MKLDQRDKLAATISTSTTEIYRIVNSNKSIVPEFIQRTRNRALVVVKRLCFQFDELCIGERVFVVVHVFREGDNLHFLENVKHKFRERFPNSVYPNCY